MGDISEAASAKLARFCDFQMKTNPSGIGNECTHVVYAGLFEVNAIDGATEKHTQTKKDPDPTVQTSRVPYSWGRKIGPDDTRAGDVVQFDNVTQVVYLYSSAAGRWYNDRRVRGPQHTGVMQDAALWGSYNQYEAHLHGDADTPLMQVRTNRIFYETFAVSIPESALQGSSSLVSYIKTYASDPEKLFKMVNWGALRTAYPGTVMKEAAVKAAFTKGTAPEGVAVHFQVMVPEKNIRFYRPQASAHRATLVGDAREKERQALIKMMKKSGRAGAKGFSWDWTFRDQ